MDLSNEDFDGMTVNKETFLQVMGARDAQVAAQVAQSIMQQVPGVVTEQTVRLLAAHNALQAMFTAHPELERYPRAVAKALADASAENPGATMPELLEKAKAHVSYAIQLRTQAESTKRVDVRPARGRSAGPGTNPRSARPKPAPKPLDATEEALRDVYEAGLNPFRGI